MFFFKWITFDGFVFNKNDIWCYLPISSSNGYHGSYCIQSCQKRHFQYVVVNVFAKNIVKVYFQDSLIFYLRQTTSIDLWFHMDEFRSCWRLERFHLHITSNLSRVIIILWRLRGISYHTSFPRRRGSLI